MKYPKKHGVCINRKKAYVRSAAKMETRTAYEYYMYSPVAELEFELLFIMNKLAHAQRVLSRAREKWAYGYASDEELVWSEAEVKIIEMKLNRVTKALRNYK